MGSFVRCSWKCCFSCFIAALLLVFIPSGAGAQLNFNTVLHDTQITQVPGEPAFQVDLFVSVLDENNSPLKDLKADNFTVLQDSQPVTFTLSEAPQQGTSLVLVVDTSGSMAGQGIQKAREALQIFLQQQKPEDQVAVISFNSKVTTVSDFSANHALLARQIETIEAVPNAGTCLYDALYQAVQMSSLAPNGRRAVLALTDGRDELTANGQPCSSAKIDDVIHSAASSINTPIYSIGVGKTLDENGLQRMALLTGGSFLKANDFNQLPGMFETMQAQLSNQYLLSFVSRAPAGDYSITVKTVLGSSTDTDTREIRLPDPGPMIKIASPAEGETVDPAGTFRVEFLGKAEAVEKVRYDIEGQVIGEVSDPPYALDLASVTLPSGEAKLTASALDAQGEVLSSQTVSVVLPQPAPTATAAPTEQPTPTVETVPPVEQAPRPQTWAILGIVAAALALLAALFFLVLRPALAAKSGSGAGSPLNDQTSEATFDSALPAGLGRGQQNCGAILTVLYSDDPSRVGEKVTINQAVTHIGRSSNNELVFPKDHPVSRRHAVIEYKDGQFLLSEALTGDENGMKAPTFGSFVNEESIGGAPTMLRNGDEIRLGNRLRLRFEMIEQPMQQDPRYTYDQ